MCRRFSEFTKRFIRLLGRGSLQQRDSKYWSISPHAAFARHLRCEPLEHRRLLSIYTDFLPYNNALIDPQATNITPTIESTAERLGFDGETSQYPGTLDADPAGTSYMLTEHWGGSWSDAEKSPTNDEDDLMCWAAAAANVLEWTGWGGAGGMANTDEMFAYFQEHWTDEGSLMEYGWDWWFDGINDSQGWADWAQVDVRGGGFYLSENFRDFFHKQVNDFLAMSTIDQYFHSGYGVALGSSGPSGSHALTCWGYNYDPSDPTDYKGIWVTDSDDDKNMSDPPDELHYYEVVYSSSKWYLQNFYGSDSWYIDTVQALEKAPWVLPGDANSDGTVNQSDAEIVSANWLMQTGASWTVGDFNNDGRVNGIDATIMAANWQLTLPPTTSSSVAIEPAMETLLAAPAVLPADANTENTELRAMPYDLDRSGKIDLGDLALFASVYRERPGITTENPYAYAADFNRSGAVDLADLAFFADNYRLSRSNDSIVCPTEVGKPISDAPQTATIVAEKPALLPSGSVDREGAFDELETITLAQQWMMCIDGMEDVDDAHETVFAALGTNGNAMGLYLGLYDDLL